MATDSYITGLAAELLAEQATTMHRDRHHGKVARYLKGDHDLPFIPRDSRREYRIMAQRSITNLLPRVSDTFVKLLTVDGYRLPSAKDNAAAWRYWQANKLDARQTIAHRGAIEYGASYVLVLPGAAGRPVIRPLDPLRSMAWYEDQDDEWPVYGLRHIGQTREGMVRWALLDNKSEHTLLVPGEGGGKIELVSTQDHRLGVTPMIRFRDRLDGKPTGVIRPLMIPQDRINDTVFALDMAMHFASFRQRWATGLAIPVDENPTIPNPAGGDPLPNPNFGLPIEAFDAAVDRLWVTDSIDAKFGDFSQTDVNGHLRAYDSAVTTMAVLGQLPAGMMTGNLVNVSAEALASLYDVTQRQADVYELLFGEAWEQVFSLAAVADGQSPVDDAQIRWRDTDARSFTATVDALGKMVQMLGVPAEAAWEMVPDVTDGDIKRWRSMAKAEAAAAAAANPAIIDPALAAQGQPAAPAAPSTKGAPPAKAAPPAKK